MGYADEVISSAPVGYWKLWEDAGATVAKDEVAGNDGTYVSNIDIGLAGLTQDPSASSATFRNGYVLLPTSILVPVGSSFSVELLFFMPDYDEFTNYEQPIFQVGTTDSTTRGSLGAMITTRRFTNSAGDVPFVRFGDLYQNQTAPSGDTLNNRVEGRRTHLVVSYLGTDSGLVVTAHVNGEKQSGLSNQTWAISNDIFAIGAAVGRNFKGGISDVAYYDRVLTSGEVLQHFNAMSEGCVTDTTPEATHTHYTGAGSDGFKLFPNLGKANLLQADVNNGIPIPLPVTKSADSNSGLGSIYFDGTTGIYQNWSSIPTHGSGRPSFLADFTIEGWIRPEEYSRQVMSATDNLAGERPSIGIKLDSAGNLALRRYELATGDQTYSSVGTISLNVWTHYAFVVKDGTLTLFLNGVADSVHPGWEPFDTNASNTEHFGLGWRGLAGNSMSEDPFKGSMEGFRITEGVARYSDDFTPPSGLYCSPPPPSMGTRSIWAGDNVDADQGESLGLGMKFETIID